MTDAPFAGAHAANESVPAVPSPAQNPNGFAHTPTPDEEPYTIKCVCNFADDDGSTVFCEYCETWQHIDCYYPDGKVPEIHTCVGCSQGQVQVDVARAIELQMRRREKGTVGDRKARRTTAKSHKRKPRDSVQLDGSTLGGAANVKQADNRKNGTGRDNVPPQKKARIGHKVTTSIASQADKRAAGLGRRRAIVTSNRGAASSPESISDVHSPCVVEPHNQYSAEFLRLQDDDPGDSPLQANLFSSIAIPGILANWIQDTDSLRAATNGHAPGDVLQRVDGAFELLPLPEIVKRTKQDQSVEYGGRHPTWQYVVVNNFVPNGGLVGEIKGQVGLLDDYYNNPSNRWQYLLHPEPFVFFHPLLPIYIDTRREGTRCRYIRMSCRPNVVMRTLISDGTDYHFCFCAIKDIEPGAEITIGWHLDAEIRNLLGRALHGNSILSNVKTESLTAAESERISEWAERILSNYGGCACDDPQRCALARYERRRYDALAGVQQWSEGGSRRKSRTVRVQDSPSIMGHAELSRAEPESLSVRERRDDNDESRSTSGSFRSKPHSRDITPLIHFSSDVPSTGPLTQLSDREKRKIAAVERTFEQQESQHGTQKKRRRNVGVPALATSGLNSTLTSQSQLMAGMNNGSPNNHEPGEFKSEPMDWSSRPGQSSRDPLLRSANHSLPQYTSSSSSAEPSLTSNVPFSSPRTLLNNSASGRKVQTIAPGCPPYKTVCMQDSPEGDGSQIQLKTLSSRNRRSRGISAVSEFSERPHLPAPLRNGDKGVDSAPQSGQTKRGSGEPESHAQAGAEVSKAVSDLQSTPQNRQGESTNLSGIHQIDPNVQKLPRADALLPGADIKMSDVSTAEIKPPLALPRRDSPVVRAPADIEVLPNRNGPPDLRVQLPHTPQPALISSSTPSSAAGSMAYSPGGHGHLPVMFSPSVGGASVQSSPVKKKLSFQDYLSRKKTQETQSVEGPPPLESSAIAQTPTKPEEKPTVKPEVLPAEQTMRQEGPRELEPSSTVEEEPEPDDTMPDA